MILLPIPAWSIENVKRLTLLKTHLEFSMGFSFSSLVSLQIIRWHAILREKNSWNSGHSEVSEAPVIKWISSIPCEWPLKKTGALVNFSSGFYVHCCKIYKTGGKLHFLAFFVSRKSNLLYPGENTKFIRHNWYVVISS